MSRQPSTQRPGAPPVAQTDAEKSGKADVSGARVDPYSYDGFREAARDPARSVYGKIGFPDSYREGKEAAILSDIRSKVTNLDLAGQVVVDIGSGCSPLTVALIEHCCVREQRLFLIDSPEMLDQVDDARCAQTTPGRFPFDHRDFVARNERKVDVVIVYSVLQYVLAEGNLFEFLDSAVSLLSHGGQLLAGDLPNESMRSRFAKSPAGADYMLAISGPPAGAHADAVSPEKFDDSIILPLLARYRDAGLHAYLVPQAADLPMANRREDLLLVRP